MRLVAVAAQDFDELVLLHSRALDDVGESATEFTATAEESEKLGELEFRVVEISRCVIHVLHIDEDRNTLASDDVVSVIPGVGGSSGALIPTG